jgi:hypothetical protein
MDAAHVRKLAGVTDLAVVVDAGDVLSRIEALDRPARNGRERAFSLRRFPERGLERLPLPACLATVDNGLHQL